MKRNLPQISNTKLIGFEQRLTLGSELIHRAESLNEDEYFEFMCGKRAFSEKDYERAKVHFDKVIENFERKPLHKQLLVKLGAFIPYDEYYNSLLLRGNIWFQNEEVEMALKDYSKCISLDNLSPVAFRNRAICYMDKRLFELAILDFREITKKKEFCPEIHRYLGVCYKKMNKNKESIRHLIISTEQGDEESASLLEKIINKNRYE